MTNILQIDDNKVICTRLVNPTVISTFDSTVIYSCLRV